MLLDLGRFGEGFFHASESIQWKAVMILCGVSIVLKSLYGETNIILKEKLKLGQYKTHRNLS